MSSKNVSRTVKLYIDNQEIDGSVKSIKSRIRELTAEMNKLTVGTKEYEERAKKIRELNGILAEHRRNIKAVADETNTLSSRFGKIADGFNRYMGVIGGAIASITGLTMTIRKSVQDFADMEEAEAQVRKYTGMTAEQVKELNEELKALDTRTSREELNALAGEAGRLGITSKDAIMEFVDGADKIRVALGDDLGVQPCETSVNSPRCSERIRSADSVVLCSPRVLQSTNLHRTRLQVPMPLCSSLHVSQVWHSRQDSHRRKSWVLVLSCLRTCRRYRPRQQSSRNSSLR